MNRTKRRSRRMLLAATVSVVTLITGTLNARHASAQFGVCYGDPVVALSNGRAMDLSVMVTDVSTDVKSVVYTLHAPAGTTVTGYYKTPGNLGHVESFQFVADNSAGVYDTTTTVTTGSDAVPVTAWSTLVSFNPLSFLGSTHVSGLSGQPINSELVDLNP